MIPEADLVHRIVTGFLEPALLIPKEDWHRHYRGINRAAGVIAGWAFSQQAPGGEWPGPIPKAAQRLVADVEEAFLTRATDMARVDILQALAKRVAAVLVEMGL